MDEKTKLLVINELERLTTGMDIPVFRRSDVLWLMRNAAINNEGHPSLKKVLLICKQLS